jgi:hypothetical protein
MTNKPDAFGLPTITFTIDQLPTLEEGYPVRKSHSVTMHVSADDVVSPELIRTAARDAELMAQLLRERPDEMREFYNHVVNDRREEGTRLARSIGLSELRFKEQGGGMWPYILGAAVVILGCAAFDCGDAGVVPPDGHGSTDSY